MFQKAIGDDIFSKQVFLEDITCSIKVENVSKTNHNLDEQHVAQPKDLVLNIYRLTIRDIIDHVI